MPSSWERKTASILRKKRVPFWEQHKILAEKKYRVDFLCKLSFWRYFIIEVDWESYHCWFFNEKRDKKRDKNIKKFAKVKIYRVKYKVVNKKFINSIKRIIFFEKCLVIMKYILLSFIIWLIYWLWKIWIN